MCSKNCEFLKWKYGIYKNQRVKPGQGKSRFLDWKKRKDLMEKTFRTWEYQGLPWRFKICPKRLDFCMELDFDNCNIVGCWWVL